MACFAIAAAGIALVGITILRHELWRDELQAWQIARASDGFHSLVHNTRYEGHPLLWFGLLYPIAHAHAGPGAMQLLQFFIASTTISVAVWRAPFTLFQTGALRLRLLHPLRVRRARRAATASARCSSSSRCRSPPTREPPTMAAHRRAAAALMALTSVFGAVVAVAVLARPRRRRSSSQAQRDGTGAAAGAIARSASHSPRAGSSSRTSRPAARRATPAATTTGAPISTSASARSSVSSVWRALVPIPSLERAYWNTNIVSARVAWWVCSGSILFVIVAWVLRDRPGSFVVWVGRSRARRRLPLRPHRHRDGVAPHRTHLPLPRRRDVVGEHGARNESDPTMPET